MSQHPELEKIREALRNRKEARLTEEQINRLGDAAWEKAGKVSSCEALTKARTWPGWIPAVATAATFLLVLQLTFQPKFHVRKASNHMAAGIADCRYVGNLDDKGILEVPGKDGKAEQKTVKPGDMIMDHKVLSVNEKEIIFEDGAGKRWNLKLRGGPAQPVDMVDKPKNPDEGKIAELVFKGKITDQDLNPVLGWVNAYDDTGLWIGGAQSDSKGFYSFNLSNPAAYMEAGGVTNDVTVEMKGPFKKSEEVDFKLNLRKLFAIEGKFINSKGDPLPYAQISAFHGDGERWSFTSTNDKGEYKFEVSRPVFAIEAKVAHLTARVEGNWREATTVNININKDDLFKLKLNIHDGKEKLKTVAEICMYDAAGFLVAQQALYSPDPVELQVNRAVRAIVATAPSSDGTGGKSVLLDGNWNSDAEIDIDISKIEWDLLKGTALDTEGKPLPRLSLTAFEDLGKGRYRVICTTSSDKEGNFEFKTNQKISYLAAYVDGKWRRMDGPWSGSANIEFDARKTK